MAQYIAKHHVDINIEKTLIVKQPTKLKIILGRRNEEFSVYSRKESASIKTCFVFLYSIRFRNIFITNKIKH